MLSSLHRLDFSLETKRSGTRHLTSASRREAGGEFDRPLADVEALGRYLTAARQPRGKRRKRLLAPRRPKPSGWYSRDRARRSAWSRAYRHLMVVGYRALNDMSLAGYLLPPDEESFAEALIEYVHRHLGHLIEVRAPGEDSPSGFMKWEAIYLDGLDRLVEVTTTNLLGDWEPDWIHERVEAGRRGGKRSRRGPTWSAADLDRLTALHGLTVAQQAEQLRRTPRTVERMRKALRDRVSTLGAL